MAGTSLASRVRVPTRASASARRRRRETRARASLPDGRLELPWARELGASLDGGDFRRGRAVEASSSSPFASSAFAWAYWRGYRQAFGALGYPGAEREASTALRTLAPCERLLDASCGPGVITEMLARAPGPAFGEVIAVDYSEAMVRAARERCGDVASVCAADVSDLPFADGAFDAVHSSAGAHCWDKPEDGFRELNRVLKPGGKALISTVVLLKKTGTESAYERGRRANTPFWDERAVCRMMESVGFKNVEVVGRDKCFVAILASK